MFKISPNLVVP